MKKTTKQTHKSASVKAETSVSKSASAVGSKAACLCASAGFASEKQREKREDDPAAERRPSPQPAVGEEGIEQETEQGNKDVNQQCRTQQRSQKAESADSRPAVCACAAARDMLCIPVREAVKELAQLNVRFAVIESVVQAVNKEQTQGLIGILRGSEYASCSSMASRMVSSGCS